MASFVYYKFKSQRDESKISFDGTGITVFDLRKEIVLANNLKANDFDLLLFDPSNEQEYKDDTQVVPRSSSVIAKRVPATKPGKGKGAMYILGGASTATTSGEIPFGRDKQGGASPMKARAGTSVMSVRFDGKEESSDARPLTPKLPASSAESDEAAAMAAMFKAQTDVWEETQEKMSHAVPVYATRGTGRGGRAFVSRQPHHQPDRPLPPSYVCYRCGTKGHWIHDCPTNNDRDYDNRPRIKRTTGIPRSFLKAVESPSEGKLAQGVMVTPDGGYVVAQPDVASWQKQVTRFKGLTPSEVREKPPADHALACSIDGKLFLEAVKTPCCSTVYCEECIHSYLLENDFICPKCSKKISSLDSLIVDKPMRTRVGDYIDKVIKENKEAEAAALKAAESKEESKDESALQNDGEVLFDHQPGSNFDLPQLLNETIPQLQGQVTQLSAMLQNPSLPSAVRQSTARQLRQTQMELQQAQAFAALAADMTAVAAAQQGAANMNQGFQQNAWSTPFPSHQPTGVDSAYQRVPINNRRRGNKRERPSDFLEIGTGEPQVKMPKFWE